MPAVFQNCSVEQCDVPRLLTGHLKIETGEHTRGVVASLTIRKTNRGKEVKPSVSTKLDSTIFVKTFTSR